MYDKKLLMQLIRDFNIKANKIGDYQIDVKKRNNDKRNPYQIVMLTEDGEKEKYIGNVKEVCNFITGLL